MATYEEIRNFDYLLTVNVFDKNAFSKEPEQSLEEIKQEIKSLAKEIREIFGKVKSEYDAIENFLTKLEKDGELF